MNRISGIPKAKIAKKAPHKNSILLTKKNTKLNVYKSKPYLVFHLYFPFFKLECKRFIWFSQN